MRFTAPNRRADLRNALLDTRPLSQSLNNLGNAFTQRRQEDENKRRYNEGVEFRNKQASAQAAARKAAAQRQAVRDKESARRFDLTYGLQRDQFDLQKRQRDPSQAYNIRADQAQKYGLDPKSAEGRRYILTGQLGTKTKQTIFSQRHEAAVGLGLQPGTQQYKTFVLTGKVEKPEESTANKISGGLNRLATVPQDVGRQSFEYATGPLQGDENSAWFNPGPPLARAWGSLANSVFGNDTATTDVRNRIAGDVEALAAVIKPLIRKPGEGPWTDADQKRLVAVVGSLAESNNADEYARNLENVRQRIIANFGIDLPPIGGVSQGQQTPQQLPPGVTVRRVR